MKPAVVLAILSVAASGAARPERTLLQTAGCRTIMASGGLTLRDSYCRSVTVLPTGSFVDFTGVRQANKCQSGCDWVQVRYNGGTYWAAAGCGTTAYMAYCTHSFGTPSNIYNGVSAPMASATAQRWPLGQAQVSRPAVCYKSTSGAVVGIGNQPPACPYAATYFAAPRAGNRFHNGLDLFAPVGTPVYATEPGRVAYIIRDFYAGTSAICIQHDSGKYIVYGEVNAANILKRVGDRVSAGTQIGTVGYQSGSTMLHFEVWAYQPSGYYCQSYGRLCAGLLNPTKYLLAAQMIV